MKSLQARPVLCSGARICNGWTASRNDQTVSVRERSKHLYDAATEQDVKA